MKKKSLSWYLTSLITAAALGISIRLFFILPANFPLNDGGLFYTMTYEIITSSYALPRFTSYNQEQIPFVYPPLSFYITAIVSEATSIPLIDLFIILPFLASCITIPLVYLLSKFFLPTRLDWFLAALFFAVVPRSYEWLIMGGGITRSFGLVFALATLYFFLSFLKKRNKLFFLIATVCLALTILSHPETTTFAIIGIFIFALSQKYRMVNTLVALGVSAGALLLSSPWWVTIILRHDVSPFLAATQTGLWTLTSYIAFFFFIFAEEPASHT